MRTTKFRNSDAALMIILLLPYARPQVQQEVIKRLALLLEANPSNKKALCEMHVLSILLRLLLRFPEEMQPYYLQLVALLGVYDISAKEVRDASTHPRSLPSFHQHTSVRNPCSTELFKPLLLP
jgi:hypothetical protein